MKIVVIAFLFAAILFIWEIATILLEQTGLPRSKARFQAISLITSTGFTTRESEIVMNHPLRRRISSFLMVVGPVGLTLLLTAAVSSTSPITAGQFLVAIIALFILARILTYNKFENALRRFIKTKYVEQRTAYDVLRLDEDYAVAEVTVTEKMRLRGAKLSQTGLRPMGMLVLGIERDDGYIHMPGSAEEIQLNDTLLIYGKVAAIEELSLRGPASATST